MPSFRTNVYETNLIRLLMYCKENIYHDKKDTYLKFDGLKSILIGFSMLTLTPTMFLVQ